AKLEAGACQGCHVVLSPSDLAEVRKEPTDVIVNCPECGCLLVREAA
ncbi:MAG: C4-type zinc ribbon domain-containing protein, partial [Microbacterium sp.]